MVKLFYRPSGAKRLKRLVGLGIGVELSRQMDTMTNKGLAESNKVIKLGQMTLTVIDHLLKRKKR